MKKSKDAVSTAAMEIVTLEHRQDELAKLSLKKREAGIATGFESAGKTKTHGMMEAQHRFMKLVEMKAMKESKKYSEELGMSWEQYCNYCGESRRTVDDQLQDLKPFKSEFLARLAEAFGTELHKIKYLGEAISAKSAGIKGNLLIYDGREIAIVPENKDQIQEVLDQIENAYKTDLDKTREDLADHKKLVKQKNALLEKNAKTLARFENRAEGKGLSPEEDAFERQIENFQTAFSGYMSRVEPGKIEELNSEGTVTPQMRARYLTLLQWMFMQVKAARDTAEERFGGDLKESEWKPK